MVSALRTSAGGADAGPPSLLPPPPIEVDYDLWESPYLWLHVNSPGSRIYVDVEHMVETHKRM